MTGDPTTPSAEEPAPQAPPPDEQPMAPAEQPMTTSAAPAPASPLVAWEPPVATTPVWAATDAGYGDGQPPFTVGALVSDTFARYGADVLRLLVVSVVATGLSWLTSFAVPAGSNPFAPRTGFVDVTGILGLLTFVAGIVGSSTMLALAEGGRAMPFGRAIRRAIERSGWLFLTSLLIGVTYVAVILIAFIPLALVAVISPLLIVIPLIVLFAVFIWAGVRLLLALPASVADNRNSIEALKLSWRVTRPSGVWLRLLAVTFVLGLLVAPGAIGVMLLVFPSILTAMFSGGGQQSLLLLLAPAVMFSVVTPLSLLAAFSAYRRLVPPADPSWTATVSGEPAVAPSIESVLGPPPAPAAPPAPVFRVPRLGTAGKALIALVLAFNVAGIAAIPTGITEMAKLVRDGIPGFPGFPGGPGAPFPGVPGAGFVVPGQVAFGTNANLETCTIDGQLFFATAGTPVEFLASLDRRVTPQDEVFLQVTHDGDVLETTLQDAGVYDCLGSDGPEPGLVPGVYTYEIIVNGTVSATGSLIVQ